MESRLVPCSGCIRKIYHLPHQQEHPLSFHPLWLVKFTKKIAFSPPWRIYSFQNGLLSSPTLLQTQSFLELTHSMVVRPFYLGYHNVHTTIPHTNQTPLWHVWMGFVIYYYPCTNTHIRITPPPHCPRWVVLWSALSVFAFTSFSSMVSFHQRNQFSLFCGRKNRETRTVKKGRDMYHQFSSAVTNFHPPLWLTRVPIHA